MPPSVSPVFLHSSISAIILRFGVGVRHAHRRCFGDAAQLFDAQRGGSIRLGRADARHVAEHVDSERRENLLCQGADRHARSGFARGSPFEHVADIFEIVFEHARKVGMAGPRARDDVRLGAIVGIGGHPLDPILEVAILDDERDRTAERFAEADAGNRPHFVLFDQHSAAAAVALLAAREIGVDRANVDVEAGGHAFDRRHQFGAVRFTGSQKTQHRFVSPPARIRPGGPPSPDSTRLDARAKAVDRSGKAGSRRPGGSPHRSRGV